MRVQFLSALVGSIILLGASVAQAQCENCSATKLAVSNITTPRSAGTISSVKVIAQNSTGSTATGYRGTIHFTSTDTQAVLPANYTFTSTDAGVHTFTNGVTLKTAGTQSVTATDSVTSSIKGSQTGISVTALSASKLLVSGVSTPRTAGTATSFTVIAADTYGNTATTYRGTVHLASTDTAATLPANYAFTSTDNGSHTFTSGATLKTVGTQSVTATDTLTSTITGSQPGIVVNPGPASTLVVSGISTPRAANTASSVTVAVRDAWGNAASGYQGTVHFTSSDSQAVLPGNYPFVAGDSGVHTFTNGVTLKTGGTQSVTATDTVTSTITGSETGIVVTSNAATHYSVTGISTPMTAGAQASVTVKALDSSGNVSTGYTGTIHFTSTDGQAVWPANYAFVSGDAGVHTFTNGVTLKTTGTQSITATDTVTSTITGSQTGIQVNAAGAATLSISGISSPTTAGASTSATVRALDPYGNQATGYLGTAKFISTDTQASLPANYIFTSGDSGSHTFTNGVTLKIAGAQSVTATDTVTSSITGTQGSIQVNAAAGSSLTVSGLPSPSTAGTASTVTVQSRDAYGNLATSYSGTVRFTSSDVQATLPANFSFSGAGGTHTFTNGVTLKTAATQSLTATDTVTTSITGTQGGIQVNAAAGSALTVSGLPSPITAGTAATLTVQARDAYGNLATNYAGTVQLASSDPQATVPANFSFSGSGGAHTFTNGVTLKTVGPQSVTATDTVTTSITGTQGGIQVNAAAASALTVSGFPSPSTAGTAGTVTSTARDAYGNLATGYTGTVTLTSSDPQASPATHTFTSGDAGSYGFSFTLKTAGAQSITASDGTRSASQTGVSVLAAGASTLSLSGISSPIAAGSAATLTVQAKDTYGNLATSYAGTVRFTSSDAQSTVPANFSFSGSGGTHTFTNGVTLRTAGTQSVSAGDIVNGSIAGQQSGISVSAAGPTSLAVTGTGPATAGVATQATVTLFDPYGNVAIGYLGTVHLTSSDSLATLPADRTFTPSDSGAATVSGLTFRTAGTQSVTATDTQSSLLTGTETGVSVAPGAAASLSASGFASSSTAGVTGALIVTARDTWNNVATVYRGTVTFSSTDAAAVLPAATTFTSTDAGTRTFTAALKTTGSQSITASDGTLSGSQTGISVVAAGAATLAVSGVASPIGTGVWSGATLTAKDAYGNTATSYLGTVAFTSSDPQAILASSYTFVAGDAGIHAVPNAVQFKTFGTQSLTATDTVNATVTGTESGISVIDLTPPTWPSNTSLISSQTSTTTVHLSWTAATDNVAVTAYRVYKDGALTETISTLYADVAGFVVALPSLIQVQAGDAAGNWSTNGPSVTISTVPPDPVTLAPPIDATVATTLAGETAFLYTGPNAIQTGVTAGTIDAKRVSVARGKVHDRTGAAVPGVQVTVNSHPELGQTATRADGAYDLALNGGSALTLAFHKAGLLDAQRALNAVWQEFAQVDDVVMIPQDQLVTLVDMTNTTSTQVARGSVTTDDMGSRQATVLIPPGTTASLLMPDGTSRSAATLHIRATEFTIGSSGPAAMPLKVPPTSAYTYAVSFNADEATAVGAKSVLFSQSVFGYVENFLAFRVGAVVPNGYHDHDQGIWIPLPNGRVIKVLSITGGLADVDTDGSGAPADAAKLAALNFSNSERQQLASVYQPGQSLWRMPLQHFSCEDWNPSPAPLAIGKPAAGPPPTPPASCVDTKNGSIIECQNQVLGESIDVVGTPYSLNYRSSRQTGRRANYRMDLSVPAAYYFTMPSGVGCVQIAGGTTPCQYRAGYQALIPSVVYVDVAGKHYSTGNSSLASNTWNFEWDGMDAYGRVLQGEQPIKVRTCSTSPAVYYAENNDQGAAFAAVQNTGATMSWRADFAFDICNEWNGKIGGWDDRARALGGWTLSAHHAYDVRNMTLYRGDGTRRSASDANRLVLNAVVGSGTASVSEGAQARSVAPEQGYALTTGPDGSIYFSNYLQYWGWEIWRAKPDGSLTQVANYTVFAPSGNFRMAMASDGRLYITDPGNGSYPSRLLRLETNGTLTTLATMPTVNSYSGIAIGPEGAVYFSDSNRQRVMRRGSDGTVTIFAGLPNTTTGGYSGDNGLATQASLSDPGDLAMGPDGTLYIADTTNSRVRAVGTDGIIRTVAGTGACGSCFRGYGCNSNCVADFESYSADGALATQAGILWPTSLAVSRDGTLYIGENASRIRRVNPDKTIATIVKSDYPFGLCNAQTKDCNPLRAAFGSVDSLALESSGALLVSPVSVGSGGTIARISTGFTATQTISEIYVPSGDASEIYVFDLAGRHLRTLDGLTTAIVRTFGYDGGGRLISITDNSGNVTTVQRDGQGNPTAIVSPYGQTTGLLLDGNGYLASITNPNSESVQLQYKPPVGGDNHTGGMLSQLTDPRLGIHLFEHNSDGFLTKDTPPDGAYQSLDRGGSLNPTHVTHTTALGRTTRYAVTWNFGNASETSSVTPPDGFTTTTVTTADHSTSTTTPDGMQMTTTATPDPRFGADVLSVSSTAETPSGLMGTLAETRSATMHSATDPLTVDALVESLSLNGKAFSSTYSAAAHTVTQTTPVGRQTVFTLDSLGRVTGVQPPGVLALAVHYDPRGRPDTLTQGTRVESLAYDSFGRVVTATDPLHSITLGYDAANRVTNLTLPDSSSIGAGYDASGNPTSITPPGKAAHAFLYQGGDLESNYTPPAVDVNGTGAVQTLWDPDRAMSSMTPSGMTAIVPHYDPAKSRLTSADFSARTNTFGYSASTGQLTSITAPDGVLGYSWDGPLLTAQTWSGGLVTGTVSRTAYDANFWLKTETYGGQSVNYNYDNDGLLIAAGSLTINRAAATGLISDTSLGSVTDTHAYNSYGEEQTYTASYSGSQLYSADYGTRDGLGRVVTKTETVQGVPHTYGYGYDAQDRLADVSTDGTPTSHYSYDANGNRTSAPNLTASPVYDPQDRLTSYGNCAYVYKPDGSLQMKTCGGSTTTYDYDAFGNLRHVTMPSGTTIDYVIDGQNRRIGKKVNGVLVEGFLYRSQLQPAAWLDGTGAVKATFVYGHANLPEYMVQGTNTYRLITDQVGSVRLVVNTATGAVVERIDWDEFGNVLVDTAPGTQPFGSAGGLRDLDTGLTRFGARDYDPVTGRWTSKDPEGLEGGLNVYEYAANDPINHIDLSGNDWMDWDLYGAANFFAGMGDNLSFGLTSFIRDQMGVGDVVDKCSGLYSAGEWTGIGLSTSIGVAAGAKAAGGKALGREFSHWIPSRFGGPRSIINGNWVTTAEHALNDPYRYRFMSAAWKAANPMNPAWLQQWNRIPLVLKGAAAGATYGGASAAAGGGRCGCGG